MRRILSYVLCVAMLLSMLTLATACGAKEEEPVQDTEASQEDTTPSEDQTLYKEATFGNMLIEYPSEWTAENHEGMIHASKDGSTNPPFFFVEEIGAIGSEDDFLSGQSEQFQKKYGNQMAKPPVVQVQEIGGMDVSGWVAAYSKEDGTGTVTRYEYAMVVDGITYHFVCEYVSSASGDEHEDETTFFEFMHAMESFKVKAE